jgi:hypothetical protein
MRGHHARSEALFYYFRLEDQVPESHLLRLIDKHVASSLSQSPEITDHDDIAAFASPSQRQLPAIMRPAKVENQSRFKIRDLFRRSAS